jgi:hypothetical protein
MVTLVEAIAVPLNTVIAQIITTIPGIIYAALIILVGWIIAAIISAIFRGFLRRIVKLDKWMKKQGLHDALGDINITTLSAKLVYWWILLIFIGQAAAQLQLGMVSNILLQFIQWTPNLFYGVLVFVGGLYLADFMGDKIKTSKNVWADRISMVTEASLIFFVTLIALGQIGINVQLITDLIRILFVAFSLGIALAIGLAFGLGLQKEAPKMWKNIQKQWNKKRK